MTLPLEVLQVDKFSGGITDNYLDNDPSKYQEADNFIVTENGKLYTRPGSLIYDSNNPQINTGNVRISNMSSFGDWLVVQSNNKIHYIDGTFQTLVGPVTSNNVYTAGNTTSVSSLEQWNNHLFTLNDAFAVPMKIYEDSGGDLQVRNAGLPALASSPTCTPGAGANSYIYAFVHYFAYTVKDLVFEDFSALTLVSVTSAAAPNVDDINITNIPVLANGVTNNYDTTNIKIKIYRTVNNGTTFYYVGQVTNGTTTYNDSTADTSLINNATLYITDGSLENDKPPLAKYLTITDNVGYYGHIQDEGGNVYTNRVRMSKPNDIDSCPEDLFIDVDDEITGMGSYEYTPIVLCKNSIYRIDGKFLGDGSGLVTQQKISDTIGCVSHNSIVRTMEGTFFAGTEGFCFTDGYRVIGISGEFSARYKEVIANGETNIIGTYDKENSRILWAVQKNTGSSDNDTIFVLQLDFGVNEGACFTTWSGGDNIANFAPTALAYHNKQIIRGDLRGYIFKHDEATLTDPRIDTTVAASTWEEVAIIYNYISVGHDMGTKLIRKYGTRVGLQAAAETNLALQITSINDDGGSSSDLKPIILEKTFLWGDPDVEWGDPELIWNYRAIIDEWRRFPAGGLRFTYKQIQLTNAYVVIADSTDLSTATIDISLGPQFALTTASYDWPNDAVDYKILIDTDSYVREYTIDSVSGNTLTVNDPSGILVNSTVNWKIKAKRKNQILNLISYNVQYSFLGRTQKAFKAGEGE